MPIINEKSEKKIKRNENGQIIIAENVPLIISGTITESAE